MFLLYAPQGAFLPLYSLRLQELSFTPLEIGWACATQALALLIAPLVAGHVADRWFSAQRCLAVCALLAGGMLWLLGDLTGFDAVFLTTLSLWLVMGPVTTLGAALSFAHLPDPQRDYGGVRMWGTVGWAAAGWLTGLAVSSAGGSALEGTREGVANAFRLAGVLAIVPSGYALTLPHTPPRPTRAAAFAPLAALRLVRGRAFVTYGSCMFGVCMTLPFTTQVTPLFLAHRGVPVAWLGPTLTLAQSIEIVSLALLPVLLLRLGLRGTMLLGLLAWAAMLMTLTVGQPLWLVIGSLSLNGLCICGYIVAGQVFINNRARGDLRASAQALGTFLNGLGLLTGNLLVGWVREQVDDADAFTVTFGVAAGIAVGLVVIFFVGFKEALWVENTAPDSGVAVTD
jgi:MFS family permease